MFQKIKAMFISIAFFILIETNVMADKVVMTNNGPVQGLTVGYGDVTVEAFLGIPYAEPPVGRLRFQRPVPKTSWSGVYDAISLPPPCPQNATIQYYFNPVLDNMTEDCLYLNMWVPYSRKSTRLKPILIYFHGGAFNVGSSNLKVFDGTTLSQRGDIIVATINYRVGVMGFFTSLSEEAVGNVGLLDHVVAMNWIKANAKWFGGDPDHIVLMGNSAGAMAVAGHLVSPLTRNLFKRAILQSGGGIQTMIMDDNKRIMETSETLSRMVGCADKNLTLKAYPRIVVNCLKRVSFRELVIAEGKFVQINPISFFPRTGDEYLPRPVIDMLRDGLAQDTEMLIGVNDEEGNLFLTVAVPQYFGIYGQNNVKTISKRLAKQIINIIFQNTEQKQEKEISDYYTNLVKNGTSDYYSKTIGQTLGDYFITCNTFYQAELYSIRNPVYFYRLTRRPSSTVLAEWMGTTHFDEVQYTFGNPLFDNFTAEEERMSNRIMDRWISFIKTGNPNIPSEIQWPIFTINNTQYLNIDNKETIRVRPDDYRCEFWRDRFGTGISDDIIAKLQPQPSGGQVNAQFLPVVLVLSVSFHFIIKIYRGL